MSEFPQLHLKETGHKAVIKTNRGDITVVLFQNWPQNRENFVELAQKDITTVSFSTALFLIL